MNMVERIIKERNDALFSLDRKRIEKYLRKYGEAQIAEAPDLIFWAGVYKAICNIKEAPADLADKARNWLLNNGFQTSLYN